MKSIFLVSIILFSFTIQAQTNNGNFEMEEYTYDVSNDLKIYCFRPSDNKKNVNCPSILIFHGGGWSMGEASWGFNIAKRFASKGIVAFSVQYRLQDLENNITPYESVLDAQSAIRWVKEQASNLGIDKNRVAAYGWSAGAHLAACAAVFENLDVKSEISSAPDLLILQSPALSLMAYPNFQKRLLNKVEVKEISPAESVSEKIAPTLILIGRDDTVTPLAGSLLFKKNMEEYGNECELIIYDNVGHLFTPSSEPDDGWPNPDKAVSEDAKNQISRFLENHGYLP